MLSFLIKSENALYSTVSALALILVSLMSITFHEVAHGRVALLCGDDTAKQAGRLDLNTFKHFDLVGILLLLTVGFGWAKPVPINANNFKNKKRDVFLVALAGIATNLALALVFFALLCLCAFWFSNVTVIAGFSYYAMVFIYTFCLYGLLINVTLAAFNILPICPLDGYRAIEAFVPESGFCRFMRKYGMIILLVVLLVGGTLGRYFWYLDVVGMYLNVIQKSVLNLLVKTWGAFL